MGVLVSLTLVVAVTSNLILLPSLLLGLDRLTTTRSFKEPLLNIYDEEEDIGGGDIADLYQLRGRVGRWNRAAYAYFLILL